MGAIAGIMKPDKGDEVKQMLKEMSHRAAAGSDIQSFAGATLGIAWSKAEHGLEGSLQKHAAAVLDYGPGQFAAVELLSDGVRLKRDPLGIQPLYYGHDKEGCLCFASEAKALIPLTSKIYEVEPGSSFDGNKTSPYFSLTSKPELKDPPLQLALDLRHHLRTAVKARIKGDEIGAWLSGGLDSSCMAALARPYVKKLYTFAAGLPGAPDLEYARIAANHLGTEHHELIASPEEILAVLSKVIYHLESFDALLVRSSIMNYLVASLASNYVSDVFSGEGGDELFAGYEYLKTIPSSDLAKELLDITSRLHNTALQRVDRSAGAHGIVAHVCFLDPNVLDYALQIPVQYKLYNHIEKWILRQAISDILPYEIVSRTKSKFWEGSGVSDLLARHAAEKISDHDFRSERQLPNGWLLNTKEELLYYRIFKDRFGEIEELDWMGRTKGSPVS